MLNNEEHNEQACLELLNDMNVLINKHKLKMDFVTFYRIVIGQLTMKASLITPNEDYLKILAYWEEIRVRIFKRNVIEVNIERYEEECDG